MLSAGPFDVRIYCEEQHRTQKTANSRAENNTLKTFIDWLWTYAPSLKGWWRRIPQAGQRSSWGLVWGDFRWWLMK